MMLAAQPRVAAVPHHYYDLPDPSSISVAQTANPRPLKRKTPPVSPQTRAGLSRATSQPPCRTERRYACDIPGCDKAYYKPSRLAEHQLTHSGERPHQCPHCSQSYLRATHLHAHLRTHLSEDDKQFKCLRPGCEKKFWTATHLKRHEQSHDQAALYSCDHCEEKFAKVHLLRDHVVLAHMPAGTKPYICSHEGCSASFALKSHLKTHARTHDASRYMCSHPSHQTLPTFPTWSALQTHLREAHPPKCPHYECDGRTFKSGHALRAHLKVHAERTIDLGAKQRPDVEPCQPCEPPIVQETSLPTGNTSSQFLAEQAKPASKVSRLAKIVDGDAGKDWLCIYENCGKSFKAKYALDTHVKISHLKIKVHSCPHASCDKSYAHAANLRQHLRTHSRSPSPVPSFDLVGMLTGSAVQGVSEYRRYGCPVELVHEAEPCEMRFWRVYDVRRHLTASHGVALEDAEVRELLQRTGNPSNLAQ